MAHALPTVNAASQHLRRWKSSVANKSKRRINPFH